MKGYEDSGKNKAYKEVVKALEEYDSRPDIPNDIRSALCQKSTGMASARYNDGITIKRSPCISLRSYTYSTNLGKTKSFFLQVGEPGTFNAHIAFLPKHICTCSTAKDKLKEFINDKPFVM